MIQDNGEHLNQGIIAQAQKNVKNYTSQIDRQLEIKLNMHPVIFSVVKYF